MALFGFPQVAECIKGSFTHVVFIIIYGKDVVGQPGVTSEVGLCSFGDNSPMHLLKICRPTANVHIIKGSLTFKAMAGCAIF